MNVGSNYFEIVFGSANRILGLHFADDGDVVEGDVSLAAHAVKQIEGRRQRGVEVLPREFEDGDVMAELGAGTLAVAQHQSQRRLEDGLVGRLMGGFLVDRQVFFGGDGFLARVGQKLADLVGICWLGFVRFGRGHGQSARCAFRSRCRR